MRLFVHIFGRELLYLHLDRANPEPEQEGPAIRATGFLSGSELSQDAIDLEVRGRVGFQSSCR